MNESTTEQLAMYKILTQWAKLTQVCVDIIIINAFLMDPS